MTEEKYNDIVMERNLLIPLSDGMHLAANLYRPKEGGDNLYGKDDLEDELILENVPLELVGVPHETLKQMNADALLSVLSDLDIREADRLEFDGVKYKVLNVTKENIFGVVSHKSVKLARLY